MSEDWTEELGREDPAWAIAHTLRHTVPHAVLREIARPYRDYVARPDWRHELATAQTIVEHLARAGWEIRRRPEANKPDD
ncbi:MAG: hypothetical protein U1E17_25315 [Geminicoccaceae bacterium]